MRSSGSYTSATSTYATNITDTLVVDVLELRDHQTGTWQYGVSLDNGAHWKADVATNTILNVAADLPSSDTGSWDNIKNLKVRYAVTRGSNTPLGQGPECTGLSTIVRTEP